MIRVYEKWRESASFLFKPIHNGDLFCQNLPFLVDVQTGTASPKGMLFLKSHPL